MGKEENPLTALFLFMYTMLFLHVSGTISN